MSITRMPSSGPWPRSSSSSRCTGFLPSFVRGHLDTVERARLLKRCHFGSIEAQFGEDLHGVLAEVGRAPADPSEWAVTVERCAVDRQAPQEMVVEVDDTSARPGVIVEEQFLGSQRGCRGHPTSTEFIEGIAIGSLDGPRGDELIDRLPTRSPLLGRRQPANRLRYVE